MMLIKNLEAVMHDADNKVSQGGIAGEQVGRWLLKLKSVAYDVEDLLDDLDTKNNEAKVRPLSYPYPVIQGKIFIQ
uniref:Disease resistance N-terminal domain-containing protein n=1 Tax=Aegilops tauschii subsp. strangulata TaxID=200361 RepID=A0A453GK43_AEGTS